MSSELDNRLRVASRIATAIEAYSVRYRMDVADVLQAAGECSTNWRMFASLAGCERDYTPSPETRTVVAALIKHSRAKVCSECGLRQAVREATKSGRIGNEVCDPCWKLEYADLGEARS